MYIAKGRADKRTRLRDSMAILGAGHKRRGQRLRQMPKANWKKRKRNEEGKSEAKSGGYGAEGADDGYPPPHVLENAEFEKYYRGLGIVPECEWDAFISMLRAPLGVSFRIMGHPDDPTALALRDFMEAEHVSRMTELTVPGIGAVPAPSPIAWLPARLSWRFDVSRAILRGKGARRGAEGEEPPPPTEADLASKARLAAFHEFLTTEVDLGNMCRQEEVSMVPPELLRVEPGHRVLDMCAAPGSKTQQILEHLMAPMKASGAAFAAPGGGGVAGAAGGNGVAGGAAGGCSSAEGGYVIANDADYKRCHLLVHQAKRLNSPRLIVTNHDAQMLPTRMPGAGGATVRLRFERVLCDVPCTGDGTLRKAPDLWRRWCALSPSPAAAWLAGCVLCRTEAAARGPSGLACSDGHRDWRAARGPSHWGPSVVGRSFGGGAGFFLGGGEGVPGRERRAQPGEGEPSGADGADGEARSICAGKWMEGSAGHLNCGGCGEARPRAMLWHVL